jgi:hypothetical protein
MPRFFGRVSRIGAFDVSRAADGDAALRLWGK